MSLLKIIKRVAGISDRPSNENNQSSTAAYVDWLPKYMFRHSLTELSLDSTKPLPGSEIDNPKLAPPCIPSAEAVINRLKVLSGLNPFRFSELINGKYEQIYANHLIEIFTLFEDRDDRSICRLQIRIRMKNE